MEISAKVIEQIKEHEGFRAKAYKNDNDKWSIGYGHTKGVVEGMVIDEAQAGKFLKKDIESTNSDLNKLFKGELNQNQIDALGSLIYNIGASNFKENNPKLYAAVNSGNHVEAAKQFLDINKISIKDPKTGTPTLDEHGQKQFIEIKGLTIRRQKDSTLYSTPVPQAPLRDTNTPKGQAGIPIESMKAQINGKVAALLEAEEQGLDIDTFMNDREIFTQFSQMV